MGLMKERFEDVTNGRLPDKNGEGSHPIGENTPGRPGGYTAPVLRPMMGRDGGP